MCRLIVYYNEKVIGGGFAKLSRGRSVLLPAVCVRNLKIGVLQSCFLLYGFRFKNHLFGGFEKSSTKSVIGEPG